MHATGWNYQNGRMKEFLNECIGEQMWDQQTLVTVVFKKKNCIKEQ